MTRVLRRIGNAPLLAAIMAASPCIAAIGLGSEGTAYAQAAPPKKPAPPPKKGTKPTAPEPAVAPTPEPPAAPPPPPTPEPTPAASSDASATPAPTEGAASADVAVASEATDVYEKPGKTYYFVGLRYRGTIIPKAILNLFVDEGKTIYSNSVGVDFDIRKDGFSLIPSVTYTEYGTGDILFHEKNKDLTAQNYSVVNSSLKGLYFSADLLWSANISKYVDFEYGAGFGIGIIFGDLANNWVQSDPNGPLQASNGATFSPCQAASTDPKSGCFAKNHTNPDPAKVNGYTEPSWVNGGSKPNIFPHLAIPQVGLRIKPIKQLETRVGIGFSLTGFFFGINGAYGLERPSASK